ncbi:MAG TPA: hypothetical protein VEK11_19370 [Thermoanaerobaculia bacterium]|nr:hypothetical protein [Thermoanaerobaculia bacterium]
MQKRFFLIAAACALFLAAAPARRTMSYSGLTLDTNHVELLARYPNSRHDTSVTGTLTIWVAKKDVRRDGISHVQLHRDRDNRATRLVLGFEPKGGPKCADIIRSLTKRYGPPKKERVWYEESARHEPLLWSDETVNLRFDCGEYAVVLERRSLTRTSAADQPESFASRMPQRQIN